MGARLACPRVAGSWGWRCQDRACEFRRRHAPVADAYNPGQPPRAWASLLPVFLARDNGPEFWGRYACFARSRPSFAAFLRFAHSPRSLASLARSLRSFAALDPRCHSPRLFTSLVSFVRRFLRSPRLFASLVRLPGSRRSRRSLGSRRSLPSRRSLGSRRSLRSALASFPSLASFASRPSPRCGHRTCDPRIRSQTP